MQDKQEIVSGAPDIRKEVMIELREGEPGATRWREYPASKPPGASRWMLVQTTEKDPWTIARWNSQAQTFDHGDKSVLYWADVKTMERRK